MGPKYEFADETMNHSDYILHRIKRLSDGKLGGWIEKEENLSQEGNCWVDGNAKVYGNAEVRDNAQVYDDVWVCGDAQVYGNAIVCGDAEVRDNAQVYGDVWVCGDARVYGNAQVYGNAIVCGDARVYGNAQVYGNAEVYDTAFVYGYAKVDGNAEVYGNAKVYGDARVYGDAQVYGNAKVDYELRFGTVGDKSTNEHTDENTDALKDFVYKIDNSSKLDIQSSYDSVDAFFEDNSDDSYIEHECLTIVAVDTKVPLVKLEKDQVKDQNVFKFVVDITNEDGDDYRVRSVIDSKEQFDKLLNATIDSLRNYEQFSKYADDLENCL
jgi:carbonic anhydrase/acetyltransferase-like protein (isoleucine patch superfamily)